MTGKKAFWLSFMLSFAVLVPLYLAAAAVGTTRRSTAAATPQSGVWMAQATSKDVRTVLVMTGTATAQMPDTYALVRFDAWKNTICVASLPPQTVVLVQGEPQTLAEAVAQAGPSQGVAALEETLQIKIDHYLFASPRLLCQMVQPLGNAQLRLGDTLPQSTLEALRLQVSGTGALTLTPQLLAEVLGNEAVAQRTACVLRADGYAAFLRGGCGLLEDTLPTAARRLSAKLATNLMATDYAAYERIFRFLDKQEPTVTGELLMGRTVGERYELDEAAAQWLQVNFAAENEEEAAQSAGGEPALP